MTDDLAIRKVVILGGGTAGWMAAAALSRVFQRRLDITLIESSNLPIVGVGEATIPAILDFLHFLGVAEHDFMAATQGTYKLGIVFQDWLREPHRYWHPFGTFGGSINNRPFHHYWHKARRDGRDPRVPDYSLAASLGERCKFLGVPAGSSQLAAGFRYALHFDAGLVGRYLRTLAERAGVNRIEATVTGARRHANGHIAALSLAGGGSIAADLFLDCSGFRGALIGGELDVPYLDWRHWLPCDRAVAAPSPALKPSPPYTLAAAHPAGWRWQIPLRHRTGNGVIYSSRWMQDEEAEQLLLRGIGAEPLAPPRRLRFTPGRRTAFWAGNCVALGLASGFLEPLESTSIQLVISGIYKLIDHFPDRDFGAHNIAAYNRSMIEEFDHVRDFIILHYCLTKRTDSAFWRSCAAMELPQSLQERINLYRETARIIPRPSEIFTDLSWFYIFEGMGVAPAAFDPIAALPATRDLFAVMDHLRQAIAQIVHASPSHDSMLADPLKAAS